MQEKIKLVQIHYMQLSYPCISKCNKEPKKNEPGANFTCEYEANFLKC